MDQAHRRCNFLVFPSGRRVRLLFSSVFSFVNLSIPFLCFGGLGAKEIGRPTRIDHFDLGQDMVVSKSHCCPRGQRLSNGGGLFLKMPVFPVPDRHNRS